MANVRFSRKEFEKHIKITDDLLEKISLFGTPLESLNNEEIEIEIFPNRPDLLSLQGYLREFRKFIGKEKKKREYKINKPEKNYKVKIDSSVKKVRPYTVCCIVKNLSFNDEKIKEIIDVQEKLHGTLGRNRKKVAIGIYPLEKISLPITYKALSPNKIKFQPLEFPRELNGRQILSQHPTGRDYAHLLQDEEEFPIFVDSKERILSMPPIINSHDIGKITEETKEVFVECSGSSLETLKKTLNIIATTLHDQGGEIYAMELVDGKNKSLSPDFSEEKIQISKERINSLLGLDLKETEITKLLDKMNLSYNKGNVTIPPWRTDILHEVDIAEDIAIAYGYNNLIPEVPSINSIGEESKSAKLSRKISEILIGHDLDEISSYHLIKKEEVNKEKAIELEESKTEYKFLRPNLKIPALRILSENKDVEYPHKIFEIGTIFHEDKEQKTESGVKESLHLLIALSPGNFTQLKQILDSLLSLLDEEYTIKEKNIKDLIEGRSAEIFLTKNNKQKKIGYLGELHPETLKNNNIKNPVSMFEISLEELIE